MSGRLAGKTALITGAARGQGAAEAELFVREGARVVLTDVLDQPGEELAATLAEGGAEAAYQHLDVASAADWEAAIGFAEERFGTSTCSSTTPGSSASPGCSSSPTTSGTGSWRSTRPASRSACGRPRRGCAAPGGSIVNKASIYGLDGVPGYFAYQASKGAVVQMTRAAAVDLAPHGIRVNCICPGLIFTEMTKSEPPDAVADNIERTPLGRGGEASEIATGTLYLASDEASFVTGAVLPIDGGYTAQ